MKRRLCAAMIVTVVAGTGCYTYHPVRAGDVPTGVQVRATVTPARAAELSPVLNGIYTQVTGSLVGESGSELLVDVPVASTTAGMSTRTMRSRVSIPMNDLVSLESRRFSRWRTGVAAGAVLAAVGGTWAVLGGKTEGDGKEKPGTENNIISVFRIPFAIFR